MSINLALYLKRVNLPPVVHFLFLKQDIKGDQGQTPPVRSDVEQGKNKKKHLAHPKAIKDKDRFTHHRKEEQKKQQGK